MPEPVMARLERELENGALSAVGPGFTASPARAARAQFGATASAVSRHGSGSLSATTASLSTTGVSSASNSSAMLGGTGYSTGSRAYSSGGSSARRRSSTGSTASDAAAATAAAAAIEGLAIGLTNRTTATINTTNTTTAAPSRGGRGGRGRGSKPGVSSSSKGASTAELCEELPAVLAQMDSSDWKERQCGLDRAVKLLLAKPAELCAAGKAARVVDSVCDRLQVQQHLYCTDVHSFDGFCTV
jgi:hypothetical protein